MTLSRDDFGEFFAEVHGGYQPFAWQWLLLDKVLETGKWPDAITAPTGSGKTAVIDVHVFALAVAADRGTALPPRRLSMVVDRRVLVDDQYGHARDLAERLARNPGGVVGRVADALWTLQGTRPVIEAEGPQPHSPLLVARLRGGERPSLRWVDHPSAAAVLCSTPDMWGSRLLFRGYGSWSRSWPREAGLVAFDSVAVVDEAHLSRQLLHSARRISALAIVAEQPPEGPQPLQVVETTATPSNEFGEAVGVTDADLHTDETLRARLLRPKPVTLSAVPSWVKATHRGVGDAMVGHVRELVERYSGTGTVGCFVNTVARAVTVAEALRSSETAGDRPLTVVMICGQVRRADIDRLTREYPGLLTVQGNPNVDVLVSTQSLEVGVDLDLSAIVTELAPASAIVQRAGRVNRLGRRESGPVIVVGPSEQLAEGLQVGPYKSADLESSRLWLQEIASTEGGLSPWAIRSTPLPAITGRRTLFQRPELSDAWTWARTSDDIVGEPDLDLWLSDDLEPDTSIGIVVRACLPDDPAEAMELLALIPPRPYETFAVPWTTAKEALPVISEYPEAAYVIRGESISVFDREASRDHERSVARVRPGDIVVIGGNVEIFSPKGSDTASPPVVALGGDMLRDRKPTGASDVLEYPPRTRDGEYAVGTIVRRIELNDSDDIGKRLLRLLVDDGLAVEIGGSDLRDAVREELASQEDEMSTAAADLLLEPSRYCEVVVLTDVDDLPVRIVVIDRRRAIADEYVRQEWTPSKLPVSLFDHQKAVAQEIGDVARRHGISGSVRAVLEAAALHHDDGKVDPRFQVRLEAQPGDPVLAKSHRASMARVGRRPDRSGLPAKWRHEQLSVALAWPEFAALDDRNLAARLVGTTHGFGRSGFPHGADELIGAVSTGSVRDVAVELFDVGLWDELIEVTHRHHGVWYCAYLEALLRAADGKISGEGR